MKPALVILFILSVHLCNGQAKNVGADFSAVDSLATTIKATSVEVLAHQLTSPYNTQLEKVRSIFRWITENITYDIKGFYDTALYDGLFRPEISDNDSIVQKDFHDRIVKKVLSEKIAICDGYARLFKSLCNAAGIESEIIIGYARWYSDLADSSQDENHAWNAVKINNKWRLVDAGWASGYVDDNVTTFVKKYNDFYFLTDPEKMIVNHYPKDIKWTLLANPPTLEQFYSRPYVHPNFFSLGISSYSPTGIITNKKVRIELETSLKRKELHIEEYPGQQNGTLGIQHLLKRLAPKYKIAGKKVLWDYEIRSNKTERIDVYLNGEPVLSYHVKINQ